MIKNAEKIDYDIQSMPLTENESEKLSKIIAVYKKKKAIKKSKKKRLARKKVSV